MEGLEIIQWFTQFSFPVSIHKTLRVPMEAIPFKPFFIIQCAQSTAQTLLHTILLTCTVHTTMRNHTRAALNSGRESLGLERLLSLLALESRHSLATHTNTILLSGYLELFVVQQIIIGLGECLGEWLRR